MHFTPEVTLGNILIVVSMIVSVAGAFFSLKGRMDVFTVMFSAVKENLEAHNRRADRTEVRNEERFAKLEDTSAKLALIAQELIGQNNERIRWDGRDRRDHHDGR